MEQCGTRAMRRAQRVDTDTKRRIMTMWLAGMRLKEIANEVGVSVKQVRVRVKGLPPRYGATRTTVRPVNLWPCVVAWIKAGHSPETIADALHIKGQAREILLDPRG